MKKTSALAAALLATFATSLAAPVLAGGTQSVEQSASGLGTAYAGSAAVADNASSLYYNPGAMTRLPGAQVSLGVVGVLHNYSFRDDGSNVPGNDGGDAGQWRTLPNAYLSWAVSPEWSVGLGVSSPYGAHTEYADDWRGSQMGVEAELRTTNLNPAVAYRLSERVSLGFGLNYQRLKLDTRRREGGSLVDRQDEDSALGWNAGALFTLSPAMRVGVAYRSGMEFKLDQAQPFLGVDGSGHLQTPGTFTLSVWQQVSERWEAMGDLSYSRWQQVDGYERNSWRLAWGAAYKYNDAWKSKFGIAYDRSPFGVGERTALQPDQHRIWFSLGGQYRFSPLATLDFGYAYQWAREAGIDQRVGGARLKGDYDADGHLLGVQYNQGF